MHNDELKINSQRITFSKKMKRKILLALASGQNPDEAFLSCAFDLLNSTSKDKKYTAKLLYKWKKELYSSPQMLNFLNHEISKDMIEDEIENIGTDIQMDEFEDFNEYETLLKKHCCKLQRREWLKIESKIYT